MIKLSNGEPVLNIWFGNFYCPAFDDTEYIDTTMAFLKNLGFNCVQLDSKAWEDFRERYRGGEPSQYIMSQEYMMESAKHNGLFHNFMSLYLNADNLYPNIRFSPPIYGESVTAADGTDGKWYRYWSAKAQASMLEHVKGLFRIYGDNAAVLEKDGKAQPFLCSMWDPIVAPSFDAEGTIRYLEWLEQAYGTIKNLNSAYETEFESFSEMKKEDYWYACKYGEHSIYSEADRDNMTGAFQMWCDNKKWQRYELRSYFKSMQEHFRKFPESPYLSPVMAQWSYFINVDGSKLSGVGLSSLWDTAQRGIDVYELSPYVDNCHFLTVPVTPQGDPDAYVVSCQHSMIRAMNFGRDFLGGVFFGRFLYNNIYETLTPCEIIGSIVASGAKGLCAYGINGLDDGGTLDRMDDGFIQSLTVANAWAKEVIPQIEGKPMSEAAILFPSAMACFEPYAFSESYDLRLDLLGWYKACCDIGCSSDIIDLDMVESGALSNYKALIIPANNCYKIERKLKAERILSKWVNDGGVLIHGPKDDLVGIACGIRGTSHTKDCVLYRGEGLILSGETFESFNGEEVLCQYSSDKAGCVVRAGSVYSFGFRFGSAYTAKSASHVPLTQKNSALYPVQLAKRNILTDILLHVIDINVPLAAKGIETSVFENGMIIVNHTSHPVSLPDVNGKKKFQYPIDERLLLPRSSVWIQSVEHGGHIR